MISLTNYDFQWARSELVIIYPDLITETTSLKETPSLSLSSIGCVYHILQHPHKKKETRKNRENNIELSSWKHFSDLFGIFLGEMLYIYIYI